MGQQIRFTYQDERSGFERVATGLASLSDTQPLGEGELGRSQRRHPPLRRTAPDALRHRAHRFCHLIGKQCDLGERWSFRGKLGMQGQNP
jgi:hypothetical protein